MPTARTVIYSPLTSHIIIDFIDAAPIDVAIVSISLNAVGMFIRKFDNESIKILPPEGKYLKVVYNPSIENVTICGLIKAR